MMETQDQTYSARGFDVYRELSEQYQSPDVPIDVIHGRVGGSIHQLHAFLRAESLAHRAVATTGEPTLAGDAARQSALTLPGEKDLFLNIKLLEPPPMSQEQQQAELPTQEYERLLRRIYEWRYPESEREPGMTPRIEASIRKKVYAFAQEQDLRERAKAYEAGLRSELAKRHPNLSAEEAQRYEAKLQVLLADHKAALARHQHEHTPPARSQEQGRGIER
jgi:hypothetical protein